MVVPLVFIVAIKHLTVVSSLAVAAGIYLFFRGLSLLARKRRQNAPACKIASALPGLVEVNGVATGPNTISAPITGQPCYLYRTTVWQQRKAAASQEWEKLADETLHMPFFLDDATGQLLIEPLGAELDLQSEFHKEYDSSLFLEQKKVPQSVSLFLARHGVAPVRRFRIEECCIRPETIVFVAGTVTENPGIEVRPVSHRTEGTPQLRRTDAPEVIRLSVSAEPRTGDAMTQQSKIAAALVKAGIQSPNAWDAAGVPRPETSLRGDTEAREPSELLANGKREIQRPEPQSKPRLTPAFVLMKGSEDATFLISWRSRRELGKAYVWQSALMLCGGTVLTLAGLYVLLLKMPLL
ncbi:MAG TPA: GIDE domain-containing protein [Terriglobales bacterium]